MAKRLDITPAQYLADPCAVPSLSSSIAHMLVTQSPAHAYAAHPKLGAVPETATKALDAGSIIHRLILGKGADLAPIEAEDFRTKDARAARDAARDAGKIPVLASEYAKLIDVAAILQGRLHDYGIAMNGVSEMAVEFTENGYGGPVVCRRMSDHVDLEAGTILELKTIRSADLRTCARHSYFYGYDLGYAADVSAITQLAPEWLGRLDYVIAFCEIDPPYAVTPLRPSGSFKALGESRWLRAVQLWERCLTSRKWPAYVEHIGTLDALDWAVATEESTYDDPV